MGVPPALLDAMYIAFVHLKDKYDTDLAVFDPGMTFDWTDENAVKSHLNKTETTATTVSSTTKNQKETTVKALLLDELQKLLNAMDGILKQYSINLMK